MATDLYDDHNLALGALTSSWKAFRRSSFRSWSPCQRSVDSKDQGTCLQVFYTDTDTDEPRIGIHVQIGTLLNERLDTAQARRRLSRYTSARG